MGAQHVRQLSELPLELQLVSREQTKSNEIAANQFGLPQGLSDGWGDSKGPHATPPELLDQILQRFTQNVAVQRPRLRCLALPLPVNPNRGR